MSKMSPEERAKLEAALKADDEAEDDDDFEIEIYSPKGHGARMPYRKGKSWLAENFGIDADTLPKPGTTKSAGKDANKGTAGSDNNSDEDSGETDPNSLRFFDRRSQQRNAAS